MARLTSGRVKKTPQSGITSDRYQFLGLDQAEPDLGDPLVGPSSIAAKPAPPGTRYVPVAVDGQTGERYWLDAQQFFGASTPGAITVFDEATQVGAANSTYIVQFVGDGVSVDAVGTALSQQTGIATVRISATPAYWKETTVGIHTLSNVGIGTTNPNTKLEVNGVLGFTNSNIAIGDTFTGGQLTSGAVDNILIGSQVGNTLTTGDNNTIVGPYAAYGISSSVSNNVIVGVEAAAEFTGTIDNIIIGNQAGFTADGSTNKSVLIGYRAGYQQNGFSNIVLGESAGYSLNGNNNLIMGYGSGYSIIGNDNVVLGNTAGGSHTTGTGNIFLGSYSGNNQLSGSNNVVIGYNVSAPNLTGSNQLAIGAGATNWIAGDSSYNVGIGTINPQAKVHIVGSGSTALLVDGDVRVVGILTVGSSSITFDGINNTVSIGTVKLADESGNANYSGIITAASFVGDLSGNATSATYATSSGIATYAATAGIASDLISTININTSGIITAAAFVGDGSQLTGILDNIGPWTTTDAGIHTLGKVGIGTTNPIRQLDVNGTIRVTNGDVEIPNGYALVINGQNVVTVNSLGAPITSSSLTTVGTLQRLEVGGNLNVSGISTFSNTITGTISTAIRAQTVDIEANTLDDNTYYVTFEAGVGATSLYVDTALSYNPGQNRLTTTDFHCTNVKVSGITTLGITSTTVLTTQNLNVSGVATFAQINTFGESDLVGKVSINGGLPSAVAFSTSFSVNSQETSPVDVFFSQDGTKMFVLGDTGNDISYYTLSTAWNVSTATHNGQFSTGSQDTAPLGLYFKPDGTKFYVLGDFNNRVYQYSCSTAWDLSTASYDSVSFLVSGQSSFQKDITFKYDGTKFYIVDSGGSGTIYQYSCSTAWDLSTASYDSVSVTEFGSGLESVFFSEEGDRLLVLIDGVSDEIDLYNLSTPWNLSTLSKKLGTILDVTSTDAAPNGIYWKSDKTRLYVIGDFNNAVYQYDLTFDEDSLVVAGNTEFYGSVDVSHTTLNSTSVSWASTDPQTLHDELSSSAYRSVEYMIQATEGTRFQTIKILAVHDGTTVYKTEYGNIYSDGAIASFDVDISEGTIRLRATASTSNTVTYKVHYTAIKV